MVDEQILHHRLLIRDRLGTICINDHPFTCRRMARRHQLWNRLKLSSLRIGLPNFCEADTAVRRNRQSRVIAVVRDLNLVLQSDIDDRLTFFKLERNAVDSQFWHWEKRTVRGATS